MFKFSLICIGFLFFHKINGYGRGAPNSICQDQNMKPQHVGTEFQAVPSPYSMVISSCNTSLCSVIIEGTSNLRGILLRAVDVNGQFVGKFVNVESTTKLICDGGALTQSTALSQNKLQANWIVDNFSGLIQFRATIVQSYSTFWNVKSSTYNIGLIDETTLLSSLLSTKSSAKFSIATSNYSQEVASVGITNSSFGKDSTFQSQQAFTWTNVSTVWSTKGVTRNPTMFSSSIGNPISTSSKLLQPLPVSHIKSCAKNDGSCFQCPNLECFVMWSQGKLNYADFQISSKADNVNRYISIAFSKDTKMGDDSIVLCSKSGNSFTAELWYSVGRSISKASNPQESLDPGSSGGLYSDGWMSCIFSKQITRTTSLVKRMDDLVYYLDDQMYYLLFATGSIDQAGKPQMHDYKTYSDNALNFTNFQTVITGTPTSPNSLIKAHGILMVIAWLMMASVSMLLPRYFKSAWPDKKILDKPIWFPVHQILMSFVLIITAISFIIIFSEARGYAESSNYVAKAHPPLGIIVMILVFVNPVMSLLRCSPDSKHRWIFNYFHTMVGEFVLVIAVINIFLSFFMPQAMIGSWVVWVMVALVLWHAIIELLLVMHERYLQSNPSKDNSHQNNSGMEFQEPQKSPRLSVKNISQIKTILIVSQWIGVTGLAIAVCVGIGVAT